MTHLAMQTHVARAMRELQTAVTSHCPIYLLVLHRFIPTISSSTYMQGVSHVTESLQAHALASGLILNDVLHELSGVQAFLYTAHLLGTMNHSRASATTQGTADWLCTW